MKIFGNAPFLVAKGQFRASKVRLFLIWEKYIPLFDAF